MIKETSLFAQFLHYLKYDQRYAERTIEEYEKDWQAFRRWSMRIATELDPLNVTREIFAGYLSALSHQGLAAATIRRRLSMHRSFARWLIDYGYIDANPCDGLRTPRIPIRIQAPAEEHAVQTFLHRPLRPSLEYLRLAVSLMYTTGMRLAEVLSLETSQIDLEQCLIMVYGKGNKQRYCPITTETALALDIMMSHKDGPLFPGRNEASVRWEMIRQIKDSSGKGVTPHAIRRLFASRCLSQGMDLKTLSILMGHATVKTTERYTTLATPCLQAAVNRFAPSL